MFFEQSPEGLSEICHLALCTISALLLIMVRVRNIKPLAETEVCPCICIGNQRSLMNDACCAEKLPPAAHVHRNFCYRPYCHVTEVHVSCLVAWSPRKSAEILTATSAEGTDSKNEMHCKQSL